MERKSSNVIWLEEFRQLQGENGSTQSLQSWTNHVLIRGPLTTNGNGQPLTTKLGGTRPEIPGSKDKL